MGGKCTSRAGGADSGHGGRAAGRSLDKKSGDGAGRGRAFYQNGRHVRSVIYGLGAAIGFTPRQLDDMTMWELAACVDGVNYANNPEPKLEPPTNEEFDAMLAAWDEHQATKQ
jgi:hypothetical protein